MKNQFALLLLMLAMACSSGSNQTETNAMEHYLAIKDALVATDPDKASEAAGKFLEINENPELRASLNSILNTEEVSEQRQAFETLSIKMYDALKASGTSTTLYKQFCPMAFNNKGAFWLAAEEEVNNPYFGDRMLHCGFVEDVISAE